MNFKVLVVQTCNPMIKHFFRILSPLVGIVFLVSGIGKAITAHEFSQQLAQYGFDMLRFLAPPIIVLETAMGLLLFFGIRQRQVSLLACCFVAVLSLGYLYGNLFANITSCGCFGYFSFLDTSPLFTFVRNVALLCALLYIFFKSGRAHRTADKSELTTMACILCAVCFATGYTFVERKDNAVQYVTKGKNAGMDIENSALGEFLTLSKDSTYFVFVFSYSCPHCYNSVENLKQYERLGVADRVLALSYATDSATRARFDDIFKPNFQIKSYRAEQLFRLTNQFPTSYYVENNTVKLEVRGLLPSGYLLRQQLSKMDR